jgi:hypothetical protein
VGRVQSLMGSIHWRIKTPCVLWDTHPRLSLAPTSAPLATISRTNGHSPLSSVADMAVIRGVELHAHSSYWTKPRYCSLLMALLDCIGY